MLKNKYCNDSLGEVGGSVPGSGLRSEQSLSKFSSGPCSRVLDGVSSALFTSSILAASVVVSATVFSLFYNPIGPNRL
ncbi:hypothetical protein T03_5800 [Trichinella britovi]|uniref:Uncharacterized protein n=1 Tax=Trichinella britovi TaxID=45882 RepID=A0A0V1CR52_TRIBR|nr:hypothetical protein T03_5800 [Trichinella britovi]